MPTRRSKKKRPPRRLVWRILAGVLVFITVAVAGVVGALYLHYRSYAESDVLAEGESATVVIPSATAWPDVVEILRDRRLVERPRYFEIWARRRGLPERVRAGAYNFHGPMGLDELAAALEQGGAVDELQLTIPEGWTIFHIADHLDAIGLVGRSEFLDAARDPQMLEQSGIDADSFEGYLFPDTYRFFQGTSARDIVEKLHQRWKTVWNELALAHEPSRRELSGKYEFDTHDFVTLASLIERETGADAERDIIARVFLNRLDRSMRLQTDPTCVYGEETYRDVPSPATCKDPLNRYSTYVNAGLPPGPIANPGRASLAAALSPSRAPEARKYLFFVARRDGSHRHHFTATYEEHKKAIRRFLR